MQIRYYQDEQGYPHAEVPSPNEALGWFLEEDVQSDPDWCRELLENIDAVRDGSASDWSITGNAYTLSLKEDGAVIESEFADPAVTLELPLEDLREAVAGWMELVGA